MLRIFLYLSAGVAVFFGLRIVFKRLRIDAQPHDRIWTFWFRGSWDDMPEALFLWLFSIAAWPLYAAASICWVAAELFHATGKKEIARREAVEAKRDKTYDHLTLEQKIALLEAETQKKK